MNNFTQVFGNGKRKYFSFEERKRLERLAREDYYLRRSGERGISARSMGKILERSHSTISEELSRKPAHEEYYRAEYAHKDFLRKQENKGNVRKLDKDPRLRKAVMDGITSDCSPEQISKRIRRI